MSYTQSVMTAFALMVVTSLGAQVNIEKEDVRCFGGSDGSIMVDVPNATPPIRYRWNDGLSGQNRAGLKAGTYTVTITDASECDKVRTVEINGPPRPLKVIIRTDDSGITPPCNEIHPVNVVVTAAGGTGPYIVNGKPNIYKKQLRQSQPFRGFVEDAKGCTAIRKEIILVGERLCPQDPNDVLGPSGVGNDRWVAKSDTLDYMIRFENDPIFAMAPAQRVFITHDFDEEINPFSFRLGTFGFGDEVFEVPANVAQFQRRYDLIAEYGLLLDVVAGLDIANNRAFWSLIAIDPVTGLQPTDPLVGFLPVNDTLTGSGEGFVTFSARPVNSAMTGDTAEVQAGIIFNINEPIITNNWQNLIDALPPTTSMNPIAPVQASDTISLTWNGSDDPGGCGIQNFELFVSKDSLPFEQVTTLGGDVFEFKFAGEANTNYAFFVIGRDSVGNLEQKSSGEVSTFVLPPLQVRFNGQIQDTYCSVDTIDLDWIATLIDSVDLYAQVDTAPPFILFSGMDSTQNGFSWPVPDSLSGSFVRFLVINPDSMEIADTTNRTQIIGPPLVDAGRDTTLCPGEFIYLVASGANTYEWSPQIGLNDPQSAIQYLTVDTTAIYVLKGFDAFGCQNTDTIQVAIFDIPDSCGWGGGMIAYVDSSATGLNTGYSWEDAFTDLQSALEAVRTFPSIEEIWVAEGTYYPTSDADRHVTFLMQESMQVFGGFAGTESVRSERSPNANLVQLNGDIGVQGDSLDNTFHIVTIDSSCTNCRLDGVTISFGTANGQIADDQIGAGVRSFGTAHLSAVVIEHNSAAMQGAAIYNASVQSALTVENCIIRLNTSAIGGDVINTESATLRLEGAVDVKDDD